MFSPGLTSPESLGKMVGTLSTRFTASMPGSENLPVSVCGCFMMSVGRPSLYTMWFSLVAKDIVSRFT